MFKEFMMRKLLERQLAAVPKEERERLMKVMEDNPELFSKIAASVGEKMKHGRDKMEVAKEVADEFRAELAQIMKQ